jgi:hypothetical protein
MRAFAITSGDISRCPASRADVAHYYDDGVCECIRPPEPEAVSTCIHCDRRIVLVGGVWIDPEAGYDDENGDGVWRETCDAHDTFTAEHEPEDEDGAPCCMDPDCPGRYGVPGSCTFPGYADNH